MLFRGVASVFSLLTRIRMYLPAEVAILKCSLEKGTCCSEGRQICFFVNKTMHGFARDMLFIGAASLFCSLTRTRMCLPGRRWQF